MNHREPFGLRYRSPVLSPFGLSLSKPACHKPEASTGSAMPFDKLRANGGGDQTFANNCNALQAKLVAFTTH
jgi:hypothetical protein